MKIVDVLVTPVLGGFFHDDLLAIRAGARRDGQWYAGAPVTPGFSAIRVPTQAPGIGLVLEDGTVTWGDAVSVQYAGAGGREPVFTASPALGAELRAVLAGREVDTFRKPMAEVLDHLPPGRTALAYALSQAMLAAAAAGGRTMCEVLCEEFGLELPDAPVAIYAQSGDDPYGNVDKMILKRVDALPHGLVNSPAKFGAAGETFLDYVRWVSRRVRTIAPGEYWPTLHFDVYGMIGATLGPDPRRIADYLTLVEAAAHPYRVNIESPVEAADRDTHLDLMRAVRAMVRQRGGRVAIVADEWCNDLADVRAFIAAEACDMIQIKMPDLGSVSDTVEAVELCRAAGVAAFLGGSCTETEVSARVSAHLALAARPDMQLAKPGMGVDEGVMLVANEQARTLARLQLRKNRS